MSSFFVSLPQDYEAGTIYYPHFKNKKKKPWILERLSNLAEVLQQVNSRAVIFVWLLDSKASAFITMRRLLLGWPYLTVDSLSPLSTYTQSDDRCDLAGACWGVRMRGKPALETALRWDSSASTKRLAKSQSLKGNGGVSAKERTEQASGGKSCRQFTSHPESDHPPRPRLVTHGWVTRAPEFPERAQTCAWILNSGEQSLPLYLLGAIAGRPGQSQSNPCQFTTDISGGRKRKHELLSMERRNFSLVVLCTQVAQKWLKWVLYFVLYLSPSKSQRLEFYTFLSFLICVCLKTLKVIFFSL